MLIYDNFVLEGLQYVRAYFSTVTGYSVLIVFEYYYRQERTDFPAQLFQTIIVYRTGNKQGRITRALRVNITKYEEKVKMEFTKHFGKF